MDNPLVESYTGVFQCYALSVFHINPELIRAACDNVWSLGLGSYSLEYLITGLSNVVHRTFT